MSKQTQHRQKSSRPSNETIHNRRLAFGGAVIASGLVIAAALAQAEDDIDGLPAIPVDTQQAARFISVGNQIINHGLPELQPGQKISVMVEDGVCTFEGAKVATLGSGQGMDHAAVLVDNIDTKDPDRVCLDAAKLVIGTMNNMGRSPMPIANEPMYVPEIAHFTPTPN